MAGNIHCVSDCHQAVTFLRKQFNSFGASTSFISPQDGVNPILLAKFSASPSNKSPKTVLFYGHYDVIDANLDGNWHADPFTLHPLNGFLYGRGVTDNKGPILAALYAVADLSQHDALSCNVVFLLEGDEEAGSRGFRSAVQSHRKDIGEVDYIMLSNSYWLDDHIPCLTFGMRGVIHASLTITSNKPDLHSGVDGKLLQHEPLKDLTVLLSSLIGEAGTDIKIPEFFDTVDKLHPNELEAYSAITSALGSGHPEIKDRKGFMRSLMQKWRDPNLTIHQIQVPESKTAVTISRSAKATLSIRIVPSQTADEVASQLEKYVLNEFQKIGGTNILSVKITSKADPWLGKISSQIYSALKHAVTDVWGTDEPTSQRSFPQGSGPASGKQATRRGSSLITEGSYASTNTPREPLFIREGGSIPAISFLEKEFNAPAAMFPMGQASDNAHLDNERMRLENLYKGREVLKRVFAKL